MAGHAKWVMIDQVEPDYLDGIKSQYDIRRGPDSAPVAFAFKEDEARLIASAPELLEALQGLLGNAEIARFHLQGTEEGMLIGSALFDTIQQARAAIAKATQP